MELDKVTSGVLKEIDAEGFQQEGAYNLRYNGQALCHGDTEHIKIRKKPDRPGIDIYIDGETKGEQVHIPVVVSVPGMTDVVYNDFFIADGADVTIVAGCGIHNAGCDAARHDGIHAFHVGKNCNVTYVEKHYGSGDGKGERILNPQTIVHLKEGAHMEMETTQIKGIDSTVRITKGDLADGASLEVHEKIMTHGKQYAKTDFAIDMNGKDCSCNLVSRSVAKGESRQEFFSIMNGNAACAGHSECDAIIMDHGCVTASPQLTANNIDANLIHEAAIGKIAGEQLIKLMTLGLTEKEAEEQIINGFLK